jgi:hypothetical protein
MERAEKFLQSRKSEKTREYIRYIVKYLDGRGWVSGQELREAMVPAHIPRESYFFRIIKDLEDEGFILKIPDETSRRGGRTPSKYYLAVPALLFDEKGVIARRYAELAAAKELLSKYFDDPDAAIQKKVKEMFGPETGSLQLNIQFGFIGVAPPGFIESQESDWEKYDEEIKKKRKKRSS